MSKFTDTIAGLRIESEQPARMIIRGIDGQPIRHEDGSVGYVKVHSSDSRIARRHQQAVANRRLQVRGRSKITAQEVETDTIELLVALTAEWGTIKDGAEAPDPEFSKDLVRRIYSDPENVELRNQVDEFAADRANFTKASSTS